MRRGCSPFSIGSRGLEFHVTLRKAFGFGSSIMAMNPFDGQTISLAFPSITLGTHAGTFGRERGSRPRGAKSPVGRAGQRFDRCGKPARL